MSLIAEDFEEEPFYEDIEAPKFLDLTRKERFLPDDRYWFCSRVGCDLKHEEELDVEAVYKNFAIRAMAARSPNLKFQKALSKRQNENKKCPLSAPPKPSKPRIPRFALLSSVSQKILDTKETTQPPTKPTTTPKARVKHVAAKYMTTPRLKKPADADAKPFNSVCNQPKTGSRILKPKLVAKALLFASPEKVVKVKSVEDQIITTTTPVKKLCSGMKKLEITDQRKLPSALRVCKKQALNSKIKGIAHKKGNPRSVLCETKSRDIPSCASGTCSGSSKPDDGEITIGSSRRKVNTKFVLCEVGNGDISSCASGPSSESSKKENGETTTGSSDGVSMENPLCGPNSPGDTTKENVLVEAEKTEDHSTNEGNGNYQNQSSDEKENAPCSNIIRDFNVFRGQSGGDNDVKHEISNKTKAVQTINKNGLKENRSGGVGTQGVKYKKQKTTNPKPFRLRTDERSILKEATLVERKNHEEENQINANTTGKVQSNGKMLNGFKKSLMGSKTIPNKSTSTKDKLASSKSQQKDANNTISTPKSTQLQKRNQRAMVSQAKPGDDKACSSLKKRPTYTPRSCTRSNRFFV